MPFPTSLRTIATHHCSPNKALPPFLPCFTFIKSTYLHFMYFVFYCLVCPLPLFTRVDAPWLSGLIYLFAPRTHSRGSINIWWMKEERKDGLKKVEGEAGQTGLEDREDREIKACMSVSAWRHHAHIQDTSEIRPGLQGIAALELSPTVPHPPTSFSFSANIGPWVFSSPPEVSFISLLPSSSKLLKRLVCTFYFHMLTSTDFKVDCGPDLSAQVLPTGTSNSRVPNRTDHFPCSHKWSSPSPTPHRRFGCWHSSIYLETQTAS